jgi:beta-mannanase
MVTWEPWVPAGGTAQTAYKLSNIIAGNFDSFITSWALGAKAWGRPLYLRFAHEMNGNWYPWCESVNGNSAGQYASAWRHVKDIFTANAVTNVTWIWCPNIVYVGATALSGLYPGSSYVDMTGLDGYSSTAVPMTWDHRFAESIDTVRALDSIHPLWVDETGAVESGVNKPAWIADMFTTLKYRPEVTGLLWFNDIDPPNDYRIESTTASAVAYRSGIADARYLSAVNPGYGAGGYGVNPYGY